MTDRKSMKVLRQIAGLTQKDAAQALNVSPHTLINWEKGRTYPNTGQLAAMAVLYGCTLSDFLIQIPFTNSEVE